MYNETYRYRGHSFSDDHGRWWFDTIVPGLYPGRTRHYNLKVQRRGRHSDNAALLSRRTAE
jgi:protocatechuate 3,4-dioxygenase beta subunit